MMQPSDQQIDEYIKQCNVPEMVNLRSAVHTIDEFIVCTAPDNESGYASTSWNDVKIYLSSFEPAL